MVRLEIRLGILYLDWDKWDRLQITLLILKEFKQINRLLFPVKSLENYKFSDDFRGNRSSLIRLNSPNIRSTI